MKKIYFLIALQLVLRQLYGQTNLIPNPSFEEYIQCPNNISLVSYAKDWFAIKGTADYLHTCAPSTAPNAIPNSQWGHEYPFGAGCKAYCGFSCGAPGYNHQEWMGCKLNQKLTVGQKYYISYKLSLADSMLYGSNNIGILLTKKSFPANTYTYYPSPFNVSSFRTINPISQTNGWTNVFGSLIADSTYGYLAIGNFYDDTLTTYISNPGGKFAPAYYFVDNICLSTDSTFCYNFSYDCLTTDISEYNLIGNSIKTYPVPSSNSLYVFCDNYQIQEVQILNTFGHVVLTKKFDDNNYYIDLTTVTTGYYIVKFRISGQENIFKKTIIIDR